MNAQTIISPTGERLIVLAEADYKRLVEVAEEAADIAAVEIFRRKLAAGEEELVPAEIVNRILNGENRIRVWREHRGLTSDALAGKAGIAPGVLPLADSKPGDAKERSKPCERSQTRFPSPSMTWSARAAAWRDRSFPIVLPLG